MKERVAAFRVSFAVAVVFAAYAAHAQSTTFAGFDQTTSDPQFGYNGVSITASNNPAIPVWFEFKTGPLAGTQTLATMTMTATDTQDVQTVPIGGGTLTADEFVNFTMTFTAMPWFANAHGGFANLLTVNEETTAFTGMLGGHSASLLSNENSALVSYSSDTPYFNLNNYTNAGNNFALAFSGLPAITIALNGNGDYEYTWNPATFSGAGTFAMGAAAPEPATFAFLGLGVIGLIARRRRVC